MPPARPLLPAARRCRRIARRGGGAGLFPKCFVHEAVAFYCVVVLLESVTRLTRLTRAGWRVTCIPLAHSI